MKISIVSCWYMTSYGDYTNALRHALERRIDTEVDVVASNCGCGDPAEARGVLQDDRCVFVRFPNVRYWKSRNSVKRNVRRVLRHAAYLERARRYLDRGSDADVMHFQQTLNAYGAQAVFNWLRLPSRAARVVTVHECDPFQLDHPESNRWYAAADRIIVHAQEMKETLMGLGVDEHRIDIVRQGVTLRPPSEQPRAGIIFYGGHKVHTGKGFDTLLDAMRRLGPAAPTVHVHGHWSDQAPPEGVEMVERYGMGERVVWLNQLSLAAAHAAYDGASLCALPYTGSFAGFPATLAMAHGVPVIATRRAGLPDHLGDAAYWMAENDAAGLAAAIADLLANAPRRDALAAAGRARVAEELTWDAIAGKTLESYGAAIRHKRGSPPGSAVAAPA
jgi:glycosyltransferase involved in cell wall biosynthesis